MDVLEKLKRFGILVWSDLMLGAAVGTVSNVRSRLCLLVGGWYVGQWVT